jgi:16S rRNA G1207 methylase RsmC
MGTGDVEHYFSADPATPDERRLLRVALVGREVIVETAPGVFCPDRVDLGTSVLLRHAPDPPEHGNLLDLGCGWGPISLALGLLSPSAHVWAVDVNARALELVRHNAARLGVESLTAVVPDEVPADVQFDAIWSNPPIRVGKEALHTLLQRWLPRLTQTGAAYLVVQKNLGADSLHRWLAEDVAGMACRRLASAKGYRVLEVTRATTRQ